MHGVTSKCAFFIYTVEFSDHKNWMKFILLDISIYVTKMLYKSSIRIDCNNNNNIYEIVGQYKVCWSQNWRPDYALYKV
jgi:hypothetical protein